jgi:hypothetical protein
MTNREQQSTIRVALISLATGLLLGLLVATLRPRTPTNEGVADASTSEEQIRDMESLAPLAQIAGAPGNGISDSEWERLKNANLDAPERIWSTHSLDRDTQQDEFFRWLTNLPCAPIDAAAPMKTWINGTQRELDVIVTNKPTGAQYRVQASRYADGMDCRIKFIGNLNW